MADAVPTQTPVGLRQLASDISTGLHDLCQPLTALHCRLEIGLMDATMAAMSAAIMDALVECSKLNEQVRKMRIKFAQADQDPEGDHQ